MFSALLCAAALVFGILGEQNESVAQPDIYGLINILYIKADANLDGTITHTELNDVFEGFDKNHDGTVTRAEFVELWMLLTSQTEALANAYFYLADVTDDNVINKNDFDPIYTLFDLNHDGTVTAKEFADKWESIIKETPFAVLFTRSDTDKDEFLSQLEFRKFFSSFDVNNDGKVSNSEFDDGWSHADFALLTDADMLFREFDQNSNSFITGDPDMDFYFNKYDNNGDSKLSLLEAIQMKSMLTTQNQNQGGSGITG